MPSSIQLKVASIEIVLDERDLAQIDECRWPAEISRDNSPLVTNRLGVTIWDDGQAVVFGTVSDMTGIHLAEKVARQLGVVPGGFSDLPS
jgi:hypothetical protein